jgi:hypothetical protein
MPVSRYIYVFYFCDKVSKLTTTVITTFAREGLPPLHSNKTRDIKTEARV